ncbi:hypothetical protein [Mycobacterium sp. ITM-2016-00318]|uniref:hypothetical protein n=1 Tax=Mycobacterium sp. ITM-2016-00318 TaxID=2099693 RepID=UPI000CFA070E|nr:hypothetical protein [Mycobacterium sp. ITM-2016-00318]WNG90585.1 hypothetical protein C6A82_013465 [Mycobacterium sp. ITM-2016-00318]
MLFRVLRALARIRVTVAYAATLTAVTTALMADGGSALIVAGFVGASGAVFAELAVGRRRTRANAPQPVGAACALSPGVA